MLDAPDCVEIAKILVDNGVCAIEVSGRIMEGGYADMISMCRTLIREPDLVAKLKSGEVDGASCVLCNKCFDPRGFGVIMRDRDGWGMLIPMGLPFSSPYFGIAIDVHALNIYFNTKPHYWTCC